MWFGGVIAVTICAPLIAAGVAATLRAAAAEEASAPYSGPAAAQLRFRAIKVDVSRLEEKGLGPEAGWVAEDLPGHLQAAFAGRMAPHDAAAPTLTARIDQIYLGESGGGGTQPLGGSGARDGIEGVGLVVAPNGKVLASYPLFTSRIAFTGGAIYEVGTERARVGVLASSFAQWLPGQMGL
jgi:hypothetical protein